MRFALTLSLLILGHALALSLAPAGLASLAASPPASSGPETVFDLAVFLKQLEQNRHDLSRDQKGNINLIALRGAHANDRALSLISRVDSLQELVIQGRGGPGTGEWTGEGINQLRQLTNLVTLRVLCHGPLSVGVFPKICALQGLKSLGLTAAYPPRAEYAAITNLQHLEAFRIFWATNFGDHELSLLTNLPKLQTLAVAATAVSPGGTNVLARMWQLTNCAVTVKHSPQ